jgi:SulP family sulfate permease
MPFLTDKSSESNFINWELPRLAPALCDSVCNSYPTAQLRADLLAGLTVGIVAIPLSMALAIASGVAPQYGLYTSIIAGAVAALLGGSKVNITGPTAAFVVILLPITERYGLGGLATATTLSGLMLLVMSLAKFGQIIKLIPHPVTQGFTAGIALVIATLQIKDFLGLNVIGHAHHYHHRVWLLIQALPSIRITEFSIGMGSLITLLMWQRSKWNARFPAPLMALCVGGILGWILQTYANIPIDTIAKRFNYLATDGTIQTGIPALPPVFVWPWNLPWADGRPLMFSWDIIEPLIGPAFAITILGAIESLLCASVADSMIRQRHDPDSELLGQGIANIIAPFFGGFAATGALARTATNIRAGGRTPLAAVVHSVVVLLSILMLAPILSQLPMAALAAVLMIVAWNMADIAHVQRIFKAAPGSDKIVLLTCFSLTVLFDMEIAVGVGVILSGLLFIRRVIQLFDIKVFENRHHLLLEPLPPEIVLYDIEGPLFFGVAERAMHTIATINSKVRVVILDLEDVPTLDMTGLISLETTLRWLWEAGVSVIIADAKGHTKEVLIRGGLIEQTGKLLYANEVAPAIKMAHDVIKSDLSDLYKLR